MRSSFAFLGLPLLVLACAPKVRPPDPVGTGGAGGTMSAGTTTATTSGSSTGAGGSGGSAPIGSCTKSGAPFDIIGAADLPAGSQLANKIYLVPDLETRAMVHVVIDNPGQDGFLVRTVFDDPNPLGNLTVFNNGNTPGFHPQIGWAANGQLSLHGMAKYGMLRIDFPVDPDQGVGIIGMPSGWAVPDECAKIGHMTRVAFARDGDTVRYLLACALDQTDAGPPVSLLFAGNGTTLATQIASDDPSAPVMQPDLYTYVNGTHLVTFSQDQVGAFFSYGTVEQDLAKLQPFKVTAAPSAVHGIFAVPPLPGNDGVTLISAFFDKSAGKGQFWAGPVLTTDYATLSQTPPPSLSSIQDIAMFASVAPIQNPTWDANGIYGAGATQDNFSVRFSWLGHDGKPLVFGQEVYTTSGSSILVANAAPLGDFTRLVVWVEQSADSPPQYLVRGQKLICQIKS